MKQQKNIKILKSIAKEVSDKLHCDRYGSCVHFAEIFVDEVNKQYPELLNNFDVIEGYVNTKIGEGRPQQHTWIRLENDEIIDPTFLQFTTHDVKSSYSVKKPKIYSGQEYYDEGKEGSWFSERRKQQPKTIFKEENEELKGYGEIPNAIKRRVTPDQLEEIFQYCIDDHIVDFRNPLSVSYPPSLEVYAKRIIHDIYYMLEYHTFKDGLIVDEEFYEEIIVPALYNYFIDRIEKVYNRFKGSLNESENKKTSLKERIKKVLEEGVDRSRTIEKFLNKTLTKTYKNHLCRVEVKKSPFRSFGYSYDVTLYFNINENWSNGERIKIMDKAWEMVYDTFSEASQLYHHYVNDCDDILDDVITLTESKNTSTFFKRRIDHHKFEKMLRQGISYIFYDSSSLKEFKWKLVEATLQNYIHYKYDFDIDKLPKDEVDNYIKYLIDQYDPLLSKYYHNQKN